MATESLETVAGTIVNAVRFVCRDCGHIVGVGEPMQRCIRCGGRNIESEIDPDNTVILKCGA